MAPGSMLVDVNGNVLGGCVVSTVVATAVDVVACFCVWHATTRRIDARIAEGLKYFITADLKIAISNLLLYY